MIICIDVYYKESGTKTCGVIFNEWNQQDPDQVLTLEDTTIENEYEPGNFYKRELPPIKKFLEHYNLQPDILIVDGFVWLKEIEGEIRPGLGQHIQEELPEITIIGVAKSNYCRSNEISAQITRGESKKPLFVQPIEYGEKIKNMYGDFRIPRMLKIMDQETKK